ncbi:Hypothetical predicted protein [Mytilus galloprovincialis]|uniref:Uncharacterized protein n=1 Tax=Mytilus galloprovincialis TaxID=29158 RepID=A0A8B6ECY1_MYTGA|nr:Hypothetical predicted protein [Mytilus galloprovincialis]
MNTFRTILSVVVLCGFCSLAFQPSKDVKGDNDSLETSLDPNEILRDSRSRAVENIGNKNDDRVETIENTLSVTDSFSSDTQTVSTENQNRESIANTSSATENINTNILVAASNTMSQCVNGLQKYVDTLMKENLYDNSKPYNLHQWYNHSNMAPSLQITPDPFHHGVRSDDFPNVVDIVSTGLQKQIIQGIDISLASLLIPSFESPQSQTIWQTVWKLTWEISQTHA